MFGGLLWLIALLVVLAVGTWGAWRRVNHAERSRPAVSVKDDRGALR